MFDPETNRVNVFHVMHHSKCLMTELQQVWMTLSILRMIQTMRARVMSHQKDTIQSSQGEEVWNKIKHNVMITTTSVVGPLLHLKHLFTCFVMYCTLFPKQIDQESNFGKYSQDKKRRDNSGITKS